jgi:glycerol kinase
MGQYILAVDQGTTGTTAMVFDAALQSRGKATIEFPQYFPVPGQVEHDLQEIWNSVGLAVRQALAEGGIQPSEIAAIGITNQRETTCLWHRDKSATPVGRAIVWQDRRTAADCEKLKQRKLAPWVHKKTGLFLDPYFSATKIAWMLRNLSGVRRLAESGKIAFGTIDSYLLYRMTGKHRTDVTNASRTLLMDIKSCEWDQDLLKLFKVPEALLPEIFPSGVEYGSTRGFLNFPDGIPVTGLIGDQQAALFGQACFSRGSSKCTYGTGAFAMLNTGTKPIFSKNKMVTTVAWKLGGRTQYALEGSAFIAGAGVQWLRDGLGILESSRQVEELALSVESSEGVLFVPALAGLGAPHWIPSGTGMITGLTRGSTKAHVARATLEGIAFQVAELVFAMTRDFGSRLSSMKVDGGASANNLLMQFQSDLLGTKVIRSEIVETTALGAGLQAGLAIGYWKDQEEIAKLWRSTHTFEPELKAPERKAKMQRWSKAVEAVALLSK